MPNLRSNNDLGHLNNLRTPSAKVVVSKDERDLRQRRRSNMTSYLESATFTNCIFNHFAPKVLQIDNRMEFGLMRLIEGPNKGSPLSISKGRIDGVGLSNCTVCVVQCGNQGYQEYQGYQGFCSVDSQANEDQKSVVQKPREGPSGVRIDNHHSPGILLCAEPKVVSTVSMRLL